MFHPRPTEVLRRSCRHSRSPLGGRRLWLVSGHVHCLRLAQPPHPCDVRVQHTDLRVDVGRPRTSRPGALTRPPRSLAVAAVCAAPAPVASFPCFATTQPTRFTDQHPSHRFHVPCRINTHTHTLKTHARTHSKRTLSHQRRTPTHQDNTHASDKRTPSPDHPLPQVVRVPAAAPIASPRPPLHNPLTRPSSRPGSSGACSGPTAQPR